MCNFPGNMRSQTLAAPHGGERLGSRGCLPDVASWNAWQRMRRVSASAPGNSVPGRRTAAIARLEAVLFLSDSPLTPKRIIDAAKLTGIEQCRELLDRLNALYDAEGSPFRVEQIASGYQLLTRPEYSHWLGRVHQRNVELKLTAPALETLTIIAYRQPITRADVEAIRGVQSSEVIKQLMERQLIRIGGEDDSLGRPYLYETTRQFLQYLGIRRIDQLPNFMELCRTAETSATAQAPPEESSTAESTAA